MLGLFGARMTLEQSEYLILISESVKSGISLSDAIRLTVTGKSRGDQAFFRFADMLDQGKVPELAAEKSGFYPAIRDAFLIALRDPHFSEALALQAELVNSRRQTLLQLMNASAYPAWLLVSAMAIFRFYGLACTSNPKFGLLL